ncbi:MAG: carbohydrate ABC transporter permease [Nitriliruptorales bacterium]
MRSGGRWTAAAFVAPLLVVFTLFYLWPAVVTLASSLFRWGLLRPWSVAAPEAWDFVGVDNYAGILTSARFWNAVVNTGVWLVLFPALVVGVSLAVAILVWSLPRGGGLFRAAYLVPMTISLTAVGVIWTFVYDPDFGVLTALTGALGLDGVLELGPLTLRAGNWLSDPGVLDLGVVRIPLVNVSLVVAGFWGFTGFGVITLTAGLTALPQELVDAARVDRASPLQVIRHVVIPSLRRPLLIVATVSFIFALRTFDIVWVITQGGPATDSEVLAVLLWKQAFVFLDSPQAGRATAIAIVMSVALVAAAYPYLKGLVGERGGR